MSDINKILDKDKILDWLYKGNAAGFTIGEFASLINKGHFNYDSSIIATIKSTEKLIDHWKVRYESSEINFEKQLKYNKEKDALIESQKEEITRLMGVNQHLEIDLAESKATTELAVKGLKEIACLNVDSAYSAGTIARNTYSEIERLQNEQNK